MMKRNLKSYNITGDYYCGAKRAVRLHCYITDEPSYIKGPFQTFTRYWVSVEFEGGAFKCHSYETPYNANQCFLFYLNDCGITLTPIEKEGESQ